MRIRQSVCYPILGMEPSELEPLFAAVAEIGYEAVELWDRGDDFAGVAAMAARHGLVIASMGGHASLEDGLNNRANHNRIEAELRESIDVAVEHGVRGLICLSGNRIDGLTDEKAIATVAEGLARVAPYAEANGINLNLEPLNSKVDHPGYQCDHTAWGVAVCERVGGERVRLLYDIYHMQIMEGDVIRTIRDNIRWIGHFHTAGNPGRADVDETQELNYAGICRAIAETDYAGFVGHEFIPARDPVDSLRAAFAVCGQG